jgi:hypothetical protein
MSIEKIRNKIGRRWIDMIDNFFAFLSDGLSRKINPFEFSLDLEKYLVDNYELMYQENPNLTVIANDEIPDITEQMEPGMDPTNFYKQLNAVKQKLNKLK